MSSLAKAKGHFETYLAKFKVSVFESSLPTLQNKRGEHTLYLVKETLLTTFLIHKAVNIKSSPLTWGGPPR